MAMILRSYEIEKQTTGAPMVIISTPDGSGAKLKSRLTKKHVLIAVVSLLITGLVVTGVLVGIRIFTDSNLEVLKQANGVKQNVSTSENSVIYQVADENSDTWIVQNFDTGLQVRKIISDGKTACYVTALNKSGVIPPSSISTSAPDVKADSPSSSVIYKVLPDQIPDISYLGKKATTMCENIPTYHAVPDCGRAMENNNADSAQNSTSITGHRSKRQLAPPHLRTSECIFLGNPCTCIARPDIGRCDITCEGPNKEIGTELPCPLPAPKATPCPPCSTTPHTTSTTRTITTTVPLETHNWIQSTTPPTTSTTRSTTTTVPL